MKNLAAKLKGLINKQALIDHGEKVILGVIGLVVLICLAGTSWSRYDKQPEEFLKKVQQGEAAIQASAWTQEKAAEFKSSRDISQAVKMLHSPLDTSRYVYSTNWYWPMYPTGVKVSEPRWLAPIQPIADGGKFVMIENPVDQQQGKDLAVLDKPDKKDEDDNEFAVPKPGNNGVGAANVGATAEAITTGGAGPTGTTAYDKMKLGLAGLGTEMPGASGPVINARGTRFIAIRSVFPLGDQLDELVKAMHEQKTRAAELIDFTDFEVERQVAQPGDKPWSGNWEKVDFQATLELLERVDFDTELVDISYTDAVFTMPLPHRVIGNWKKFASHPLIKAMSDEQVELQAQTLKLMLDEAEKHKKDEPGKKKGLSKIQVDGRALRGQFSGNQMAGMMENMAATMKSGNATPYSGGIDANTMRGMADPSAMGGYQDQLTRNNGRMSKYLLLRYFDFQVNPGNAYRYRMRVTLRNPNYKREVEALVQEETALVEVRVTPWSEPTPPVYIPNEERIFLAKADKAKIETGLPSAYLDVYQWFSEAGTTISAKLEKLQLGQFVGGRPPKTEVFRPANNTLRDEEIPVFTGSVLADIAAASTGDIDLSEHADLKLDLKKLKQLGVVDKALLVDRYGQLVTLDPKASVDDVAQAEKVVENERKSIRADIKSRTEVASSAGGDLKSKFGKSGGGGYPSSGMTAPDDPMGQMGLGNPLKKGGAKGAGAKKAQPKKPAGATAGNNAAN